MYLKTRIIESIRIKRRITSTTTMKRRITSTTTRRRGITSTRKINSNNSNVIYYMYNTFYSIGWEKRKVFSFQWILIARVRDTKQRIWFTSQCTIINLMEGGRGNLSSMDIIHLFFREGERREREEERDQRNGEWLTIIHFLVYYLITISGRGY